MAPFSVASLGGSLPSIYVGTLEKRPGGKVLGLFEKALNPSNTSVFAIPTRRPSYTKGHIDEDSVDDCSNSSVKHVGVMLMLVILNRMQKTQTLSLRGALLVHLRSMVGREELKLTSEVLS